LCNDFVGFSNLAVIDTDQIPDSVAAANLENRPSFPNVRGNRPMPPLLAVSQKLAHHEIYDRSSKFPTSPTGLAHDEPSNSDCQDVPTIRRNSSDETRPNSRRRVTLLSLNSPTEFRCQFRIPPRFVS